MFELERVEDWGRVEERAGSGRVDAVLLEAGSDLGTCLQHIKELRAKLPQIPLIVLSRDRNTSFEIDSIRSGAQDFLLVDDANVSGRFKRVIFNAIERQRMDTDLLREEEKYHGIFDHLVEGIFQTTPEGGYQSANAALARIYGFDSPEELINSLTDIGQKLYVDPNRRAEFLRIMQEHDTVTNFESQVYRKDGSIIWIAENVRAIRDRNGRLLYYEGTVEDITQQKQAEENLRNSEALYHSLVETIPQNIFRKDLEERFTFANSKFCQTVGKSLEDIIGRTDFDLYPAELAAKYQEDDRKIIRTGKIFETVEEHVPGGGEKIYVQVVKSPLYDAQGKIIGLQGIFWDITKRKRAEEQVRLANAELARSREILHAKNEEMREDLKLAGEIQQTMLPQQYPSLPPESSREDSRLRFYHFYRPAGIVGGDFFNIQPLSDTEAGVLICDVMGHGVRAALVTAMLRALAEELKPVGSDPGKLLTHIHRNLKAILKQSDSPLITTSFYCVADLARNELRYSNAGHPKPLLARRESGELEPLSPALGRNQPALGLFDECEYNTFTAPFFPGDSVVLFTDGLYEVEGTEEHYYSYSMLTEAFRKRLGKPPQQMIEEVISEIRQFGPRHDFSDDVCIISMEFKY